MPGRVLLCAALLAVGACQPSPPLTSPGPAYRPLAPASGVQSKSTRRPRCAATSLTEGEYGSHIRPAEGRPGRKVAVFGPTFRDENGRFARSKRLETWWNTEWPPSDGGQAQPLKPGPVVRLTTVRDTNRCRFVASFRVPETRPGRYRVVTFVFHEGGYGWFGSHKFEVTAAPQTSRRTA